MKLNHVSYWVVISVMLITAVGCLEDETDDFTSGSYYPDFGVEPDTTQKEDPDPDTTAMQPPALCWDSAFTTTRDEAFISLFTRYGDGWTGGDATYSILLPDGRTLWIFGDTFLGTVNADRSRPGTGLIRNSFVVQDGEELTTLHGGTVSNPASMISPSDPSWWYWPTDGTIHNDTLQLLLSAFKSVGEGGMWDFAYASIDLALFTLPDLELISIESRIPDPTIAYGSCVVESSDYIYIYGANKAGGGKQASLARAANGDLRNPWEYYDGSGWDPDINASVGLVGNVSEQFAVFEDNGHYYMVTHHFAFGDEIYIWDAPNPEGPWGNQRTLYCTPETGGNIFTYNSFVHPQFIANDEILISYNNNSFNFGDLFANADNYRPHFIRVGNWR